MRLERALRPETSRFPLKSSGKLPKHCFKKYSKLCILKDHSGCRVNNERSGGQGPGAGNSQGQGEKLHYKCCSHLTHGKNKKIRLREVKLKVQDHTADRVNILSASPCLKYHSRLPSSTSSSDWEVGGLWGGRRGYNVLDRFKPRINERAQSFRGHVKVPA